MSASENRRRLIEPWVRDGNKFYREIRKKRKYCRKRLPHTKDQAATTGNASDKHERQKAHLLRGLWKAMAEELAKQTAIFSVALVNEMYAALPLRFPRCELQRESSLVPVLGDALGVS